MNSVTKIWLPLFISCFCFRVFALEELFTTEDQCKTKCGGTNSNCVNKLMITQNRTLTQFQCECEINFYRDRPTCFFFCNTKMQDVWYIRGSCERDSEAEFQTCKYRCVSRPPEWLYALFALCAFSALTTVIFLFIILPCCLCCPCCPWSAVRCGHQYEHRGPEPEKVFLSSLPPLATDEAIYSVSNGSVANGTLQRPNTTISREPSGALNRTLRTPNGDYQDYSAMSRNRKPVMLH